MDYKNDSKPELLANNSTTLSPYTTEGTTALEEDEDSGFFNVTGGRDDNLIKLLAAKLNFKLIHIYLLH